MQEGHAPGVGPKVTDLAVGKGPALESYKYVGPYLGCLPLGYSRRRNGRKESSMRLLFIYLIVAVELVVTTASSARTVNWGAKSALIDLGMTEQQVTKTVGSAPNKVETETCGQHTKRGAWTCKIHTYGSGSNKLRVWFQQSPNDRMWRAVDWGP